MTLIDVGSSHAAEPEHSVDWASRQILHAHRIDKMNWATKLTKDLILGATLRLTQLDVLFEETWKGSFN